MCQEFNFSLGSCVSGTKLALQGSSFWINCGNSLAVKGNTKFCIKRADKSQMTVDNNYAIAIAMFRDWLVNLLPIFQPMRSKFKTDRTL